MTKFTNRIKPDSTELERYFLSVYTGNLWDALEKIKDWHSPEHIEKEVQMKLLKLQQQALPVVPECVAGAIESIPDHYSAFEAIDLIKSKVEVFTEENKDWLQVYNWLCEGIDNQDTFALAFITGKYQVEKPQLFYLKHIDFCKTDKHYDWFTIKHSDGPLNHLRVEKGEKPSTIDCKFTKQEIDSMQTGSYEKIEVEK